MKVRWMWVAALLCAACNRDNPLPASFDESIVADFSFSPPIDAISTDAGFAGVACGTMTCSVSDGCCGGVMCQTSGESCASLYQCDGPEDCASGMVCCLSNGPGGSSCLPPAACSFALLCHAQSDCPLAGEDLPEQCCPPSAGASVPYGKCAPPTAPCP